MDEWELISSMVAKLHAELNLPVTCKIRIFPDVEKTVRYAKMIEAAGCQLLTVHGRLRGQKGHNTGMADWEQIKRVKSELEIPVFANGFALTYHRNILYDEHVEECIEATGCDGVMTAEGNLCNPALFSGKYYSSLTLAQEYLDICTSIPGSSQPHVAKSHFFKMLHILLVTDTLK
jgi:tRNA-dihydrouridine synthase 1